MDIQTAYKDTIDYLYEKLPQFSRQGAAAIKKDLVNITKFCEVLGEPQKKFKSVHVAGTNGKGSTSHMLAAILQQAGYRVGLYTSPHLVDFRERIRIDGQPITKEWVVTFVEKNRKLFEQVEPSFFEVTVAMAFAAFAEYEVDFAIVETGLGGRLDSTNIIEPVLSIITNISYDHMDVLGNTLEEIAMEKAGIIKHKIPVVIGQQHAETERVFFEQSIHKQSTLYYADAQWDLVRVKQDQQHQHFKAIHRARMEMFNLSTDLKGHYQVPNIKTVLAAVDILKTNHDLHISKENIVQALSKVKRLTGLKGRWDIVQQQPLIIADVAHNPAGLKEVLTQWASVNTKNKHIVLGFVKDKDVSAALSLFPAESTYYFCQAQIPRALSMNELKQLANEKGLDGKVYPSVDEAVKAARDAAGNNGAVLITGSFFIVGEGLEYLSVNNGLLFPTALE
jgi:dihydrofolate synthase/folylpolyglutamate synthase